MMEQREKQLRLCRKILEICRAELCDIFPYLDSAFSCLGWRFSAEKGFYTDGEILSFSTLDLLARYRREPAEVRRGYLHMLLHCLFLHLYPPADAGPRLWDLACDMAVEQMIHCQAQPRLKTESPIRDACFQKMGRKALSAEQVLSLLKENAFSNSIEELSAAFYFDDHQKWRAPAVLQTKSHWERLLSEASQNKLGGKTRGRTAGALEETAIFPAASQYDYHRFLQKFTVSREEVQLDPESFDYIFYQFGMEHYGSMPLIEPLEYQEVRRLEELVIAIDTSGSCSAAVVGQFLEETYSILARQENFFRRMKVYFIQCDCLIQDVTLIQSKEDWLEYAKKVRIQGRGGTDFGPVFTYVAELRKQKKLKNLKALLYFTDGDGAYPSQPPDYETAFVLPKETGHRDRIPKWGRLLLI